jgi:hypothetical protein
MTHAIFGLFIGYPLDPLAESLPACELCQGILMALGVKKRECYKMPTKNADKEKRDSKTEGIRIIIALNSGDLNQSAG